MVTPCVFTVILHACRDLKIMVRSVDPLELWFKASNREGGLDPEATFLAERQEVGGAEARRVDQASDQGRHSARAGTLPDGGPLSDAYASLGEASHSRFFTRSPSTFLCY